VFNGLLVRRIASPVITAYELSGGFLALTIYLLCTGTLNQEFLSIPASDWNWLVLFSVVGTAFPFIASVNLMKHISPYTITLTVNLETVYGIILAHLIWKQGETMSPGFYLGTFIILCTIFGNGILKNYLSRKQMQ
jgi:drug/metabolite transporter (DMT)-like permease